MLGLGRTALRTGRMSRHGSLLLLVAILVLSAYTHLWNPAGFPPWHVDEAIYIVQALDAMDHKILSDIHDHPFLGWTVLAGFMHVTGYPDSATSKDAFSLGMFYEAPRILMGLLAILDTFLIYKIAERGFGRRVAPIAAILFAVMPISLTLRLVLLDSILLPFVLSSVLLAMYARGPDPKNSSVRGWKPLPPSPDRIRLLILLSGICMGCAILTKLPSLVMIPLGFVLVWSAGRRPGRVLLWLVPVILIAAVWPVYATLEGEFDQWVDGVLWQSERNAQSKLDWLQSISIDLVQGQDPDILTHPAILLSVVMRAAVIDPVLALLSTAGLIFAVTVRNRFLILWIVPVLLFFGSIGWVSWFHLGMLWTAMCIAAAALISYGIERVSAGRWGPRGQRTLLLVAVLVIAALGLSTSATLVHWDAMSAYSEAVSFTLQNYADSDAQIVMQDVHKSWLSTVSNLTDSDTTDNFFYHIYPEKTKKIVMVDFVSAIEPNQHGLVAQPSHSNVMASPKMDQNRRHAEIHDSGSRVAEFENPPRPDTLIPSILHRYGDRSVVVTCDPTDIIVYVYCKLHKFADRGVVVTEWNPPGWATMSTYGPTGRALHLDGTAYVTLADTPGLDLGGTDPFSIAFWIKMTGTGDPDSSIISKAEAALQQGVTVWGHPGGGISFRMTDDASNEIAVETFTGMADGYWHHVVFTYDGSGDRVGLDVYVDGQIDSLRWISTSLSGSATNDHPLAIGAGSTGRGPAQDIMLDDIMIYSTLLPPGYVSDVHECHVNAAAVSATRDVGTVGTPAGDHACMGDYSDALLVHLEFEGDLSDSSGSGNGGTEHGDVRYT